jgi:outer membrane protein
MDPHLAATAAYLVHVAGTSMVAADFHTIEARSPRGAIGSSSRSPDRPGVFMDGSLRSFLRLSIAAIALAAATTAFAAEPAAPSAPRQLTMETAIELALAHNPQLAIEAENIAVAHARTRADSKLRLPLLSLRANVLVWDRAIVVDLGESGTVTVRDRVTGTADLTVSQPLSGAFVIGTLIDRDRAAATASQAQRDGVRVDIAYQTAEAYLGALQAQTLGQIARVTLQQLDADIQNAKIRLQAGTMQQVDVMRLDAERARIEQQLLSADTTALGARRRLAMQLGMPDGTELALVDIDTTPPALPWTEDEAVARARRDRAEARVAEANRHSAELGVSVARANYFPSISLQGVYSHAINAASFGTAADSAYIGLTLDWNLWDWGKRTAEVDGSRALSRQALLAQAQLADQITVDTRARWQAARTAQAMLEVTARGLAAATETQRLQAVKFSSGAATTVEVIDAETLLANAKAQAAIARYQYLVAWMALSRAVGSVPGKQAR